MPSKTKTLSFQVDGLRTVYIRGNFVCFDFQKEEQLNTAREKVTSLYETKPPFKLLLHSKKPIFAFKVSAKHLGINIPIRRFILSLAIIMATETTPKTIPIVKY